MSKVCSYTWNLIGTKYLLWKNCHRMWSHSHHVLFRWSPFQPGWKLQEEPATSQIHYAQREQCKKAVWTSTPAKLPRKVLSSAVIKYYQISSSMSLHYSLPMFTRIKFFILRFRSNGSRIQQYFSTLESHSSCSFWKPLIPANCCQQTEAMASHNFILGLKYIVCNICFLIWLTTQY